MRISYWSSDVCSSDLFISEGPDQTVLSLKSNVALRLAGNDAVAEFHLKKGQKADFILEEVNRTEASSDNLEDFITKSVFDTINYWKEWIARCTYRGRGMEMVNRSAICRKLMASKIERKK